MSLRQVRVGPALPVLASLVPTLAHFKLTIQLVCLICVLLVSLWGDCQTDIHKKGGLAAGQISTA